MTKPRLALFTVLSVAAYLGLAIAGAGGPGRFFSYPPLTAVTFVTIALGVAGLFSEGHIGAGVKEDRSNRWVIAALGILGVLGAYLPAYTDRIDFLTFGGEGVRWLGVLLYAAGGVLRLAPVFVLGRRFSGVVAIQPEHRLVTSGLYGVSSPPELSWSLRALARLGAGFPIGRGRYSRGADASRRASAHRRRGTAAERDLRRRIWGLSEPHLAPHSVPLLSELEAGERGWVTYGGATPPLRLHIHGQTYEGFRRVVRKHIDRLGQDYFDQLPQQRKEEFLLPVVAEAYVSDWEGAQYPNGNEMPFSPANLAIMMAKDPHLGAFLQSEAERISPPWPTR